MRLGWLWAAQKYCKEPARLPGRSTVDGRVAPPAQRFRPGGAARQLWVRWLGAAACRAASLACSMRGNTENPRMAARFVVKLYHILADPARCCRRNAGLFHTGVKIRVLREAALLSGRITLPGVPLPQQKGMARTPAPLAGAGLSEMCLTGGCISRQKGNKKSYRC